MIIQLCLFKNNINSIKEIIAESEVDNFKLFIYNLVGLCKQDIEIVFGVKAKSMQ